MAPKMANKKEAGAKSKAANCGQVWTIEIKIACKKCHVNPGSGCKVLPYPFGPINWISIGYRICQLVGTVSDNPYPFSGNPY